VTQALVARFGSSGGLDRSFASGGRYVVPGAVRGGAAALFRALAVGPGGIVAAGAATSGGAPPAYALALRLSSGGRPVSSFGRRGLVTLASERGSIPPSEVPGAYAVALARAGRALARAGRVVLAGSFLDSGRTEVALWSLDQRGSLLKAGSAHAVLPPSLGSGAASTLALDAKGRIVVFGTSNNFVAFNGFGLRYHGFGP
jgi:hypothetical protein